VTGTLGRFGAGARYFFGASGFSVAGAAGLAVGAISGGDTGYGFAVDGSIGKEWSFSPSWQLGVRAQALYMSVTEGYLGLANWSGLAGALSLGGTYGRH
jgi:hypothetical protein